LYDSKVEISTIQRRPKLPFKPSIGFDRIEKAIAPFSKAAMFDLRDRGYGSLFQQTVACILSIRTHDEISLWTALRLLNKAPTPKAMLRLSIDDIDNLIHDSTYHRQKAPRIRQIAEIAEGEFKGELPADPEFLQTLPGIGPKCAHLALGVACDLPLISVDIHVHRVVNRWGYVAARTPEKTLKELEKKLPKRYWIDINRLLVPFGKNICTGYRPMCSICPVVDMCQQVGVENPR
jgi:endonuclease III